MSDRPPRGSQPPRYARRALPPYRFIPGQQPHPRRDPRGHSYGQREPLPPAVAPEAWERSEWYRHGVDLYNHGFWWEAHEVFEGLWNATGRQTEAGQFFQALVHLAGANLKLETGNRLAALKLAARGLDRLDKLPAALLGVDVRGFAEAVREGLAREQGDFPVLILALTSPPPSDPG